MAAKENLEADTIIDATGRKLKLREIDVLDESRLIRALGPDAAQNQPYVVSYVMPAAMVCAIDGVDVPFPGTQKEVDATIARLGRAGIEAVLQHMMKQVDEEQGGVKEAAGN